MYRAVILTLLLGGCDQVFGLDRAAPDAPPVPDAPSMTTPYIADGDYDGDGKMNAVDLCPTNDNATEDSDGDGVGDLCDPDLNPGAPDCIVLFDYFEDRPKALDPRWINDGWLLRDCDGSRPALCSTANMLSTFRFDASYQVAQVAASFRVLAIEGSGSDAFQLFTDMSADQPEPRGRACGVVSDGPVNGKIAIRDLDGTGDFTFHMNSAGLSFPFATGTADSFLRWTPGRGSGVPFLCEYEIGPVAADAFTGVAAPQAGTSVGIRVNTITAELHYVIAYGASCPAIDRQQ